MPSTHGRQCQPRPQGKAGGHSCCCLPLLPLQVHVGTPWVIAAIFSHLLLSLCLPKPQHRAGSPQGMPFPLHSLQELLNELLLCQQLLRGRHGGHGELVLHRTLLGQLEGGLADEDRLPMLNGLHRADGEALSSTGPLHLIQHRHLGVPWVDGSLWPRDSHAPQRAPIRAGRKPGPGRRSTAPLRQARNGSPGPGPPPISQIRPPGPGIREPPEPRGAVPPARTK